MIDRLKAVGSGIWIAALAFLAVMAAASVRREKNVASRWQNKAEDIANQDVEDGVRRANQHMTQAKLHEARAEEAKLRARDRLDRIGEKDEEMADILDRWRTSNRMRNNDT